MSSLWQFVLIGLGACPAYVLMAQSTVVVYRGSQVVNFAVAGFAALGGYGYYILLNAGVGPILSLVGALVVGALAGALTFLIVMRRLASAAPVSRVIGTLGVSIIIVQALALHYQSTEQTIAPLFGGSGLTLAGAHTTVYNLVVLAFVVALTAVLWAVYRFSDFGLRTSAVAENERSAAALGVSPSRIALANWCLGGMLAALTGVLVSPVIGLTVSTLSLLLVPGLAAGLLGRFRSFWATLGGGLLIGVGESLLSHYNLGTGWSEALPFLVIIAVLVVRGTSLPGRGISAERLPSVGTGHIRLSWVLGAAVVVGLASAFVDGNGAGAIATSCALGVILLSIVVVVGYAGQVSLVQLGLAGIGAFIAARVAVDLGVDFWLAALLGVALTLPVGAIVGLPAIRTRGVNLAIVTLGLGLVIQSVVLANDTYTGGLVGLSVPQPSIFGFALDYTDHPTRYAILSLVVFVGCALAVANLRRGRVGRQLIAIRGNERAAAALGVDPIRTKLYAFVVGAGLAAIGGILLAFANSIVLLSSLPFDVNSSVALLGFAVMGGVGYAGGSVMAAVIATGGVLAWGLDAIFGGGASNWLALFGGVGTVWTMMYQQNGVAGHLVELARPWIARLDASGRRRRPAGSDPEPVAVEGHRREGGSMRVTGLTVRFGAVTALNGVTLEVHPGEILGVIGPNGAGKTTMVDAITGINRRYSGQIELDGVRLDRLSATRRARSGLARTFQSLELFEDLSVKDNLCVAAERPGRLAYLGDLIRPGSRPLPPAAAQAVKTFGLQDDLDTHPSALPFGRRRLVGIARAIAASPAVLLLDEPAAGLDDHESRELAEMLRSLAREWRFAVLLIEHDMNLVMSVCDRLVALEFGQMIAAGPAQEVRSDPAVVSAYLGSPDPEPTAPRSGSPGRA